MHLEEIGNEDAEMEGQEQPAELPVAHAYGPEGMDADQPYDTYGQFFGTNRRRR